VASCVKAHTASQVSFAKEPYTQQASVAHET